MKLTHLLALPAWLASALFASALDLTSGDYAEHLQLKPLPGGALYAGFNFTATTSLESYEAQHFRYFPRSLGQILQHTHTEELHLRFSLGRWDEESWGSRPRNGRREGGTGVELWAWMDGASQAKVDERWSRLVNSLSGLFCASLNFIHSTNTVRPIITFEPEGTHPQGPDRTKDLHLLQAALPHEVVCTENLTPFLKLLPCKGKAGISSLLDGHKLFDASWQSMAIDVRPVCSSKTECTLEIQQTVDMVLDIERSMRDRHNPIPRPPHITQMVCDEAKSYNGWDTCYPKRAEGEMAWSLSNIFGRPMRAACRIGSGAKQGGDVSLVVPLARTVNVTNAAPSSKSEGTYTSGIRLYYLPESEPFDLSLPHEILQSPAALPTPPLYVTRHITGHGQAHGGMHTTLRNPHPYPQRLVYLESLPWFLRPYVHTLRIAGGMAEKMYYTPSLDRQRGTQLELVIEVPAEGTVDLEYDFEKAVLRYTEYPPDANRGFDIAPAIIRVLPNNHTTHKTERADAEASYLRTTPLLLPLPTPDFSMPYNVIILTSTVVALGFGSVFNLLMRRFVLAGEVPEGPLAGVVKGLIGKARRLVAGLRTRKGIGREG